METLRPPAGLDRPAMRAATPPLKPRAYYRAVDAYQRARAAWRRRTVVPEPQRGVRILAYHRIADDGDVLAVRRDDFRRQLEAVLAAGARVVRLTDAIGLLETSVSDRYVCITFDDGYRDTLEHAAPILRELGIPGTVFVCSSIASGDMAYYWYRGAAPPALDWHGIRELVAEGSIDVQSHTRTHPCLTALDEGAVRDELTASKQDIEHHTGRPVSLLSYPAGLYGDREAQLVVDTGYRAAVTCRSGLNHAGVRPAELNRTLIGWGDGLPRFQAKLAGQLDGPGRLTEAMQRQRATARRGPAHD